MTEADFLALVLMSWYPRNSEDLAPACVLVNLDGRGWSSKVVVLPRSCVLEFLNRDPSAITDPPVVSFGCVDGHLFAS